MRVTVRGEKGESSPRGTEHTPGQCLADSAGRGASQAALVASSLHHTADPGEGMGHKIPEAVEWAEDRPFCWPERHQELGGGSGSHGGCWVPSPPHTGQVPSAVQGELKGQGWSTSCPGDPPTPPAPEHSPIPGQHGLQGSKQPGAGSGQGAPPSLAAGGYFYLAPTCLFPCSFPSGHFPLLAAVSGRCEGSSSWPHIRNHPPSLSKQLRAPTTGSLPLVITSAHTLGLKYMVRNRSV